MARYSILLLLSIIIPATIFSQTEILIDGDLGDWDRSLILADDYSDNHPSLVGIDRLWAKGDSEYFYARFDLTEEIDIDAYNEIAIYIDTDNDRNTGFKINGIGAEISYFLGLQFGFVNYNGQSYSIDHTDLGIVVSPTFTSKYIEIALKREIRFDDVQFSMDNEVKVFMHNDDIFEDKIPNIPGGVSVFLNDDMPAEVPYSMEKVNSSDLRVMTYNVLDDGLFMGVSKTAQERIIKAVNPDIIAFQEIYNNSAIQVENLMEDYFPGTSWKVLKAGPDVIVATRHRTVAVDWIGGNGAFLLEIGSSRDPLVVINAHLACCDNDVFRQDEIDEIMEAFKLAKLNDLAYDLDPNTPIIFTGDMNMVGASQNYTSIVSGDIVDEFTYGPDQKPDWDNSYLEDCRPIQTGFPFGFTWRNTFSDFFPGKLDYMFYSGSQLKLNNSFVLNTTGFTNSQLNQYGLFTNDSYSASDHLPIISDFSMEPTVYTNLSATATTIAEPLCYDEASGIVEINVSGGAPPYAYGLDNQNFQPDSYFDRLVAGNYSFHIRDSNGEIFDTGIFTLNGPEQMSISTSINNNVLSVMVTGGQAPYSYSLDGTTYQTSNSFDLGQEEELTIYIRDDNDCEYNQIVSTNVDMDNDGFTSNVDCDDNNPNINPDATEIPNNDIDEDCDGIAQMIDEDNDGFNSDEDCDDNNAMINPDATEIVNNDIDEDCDGIAQIIDEDNDGFNSDDDCDDTNAMINPDATEIPNNDIDEDCDGEALIIDQDMDGFNSDEDCDDTNAMINPDAVEIPNNGIDEDCNGFDTVVDQDNDGFNSDEDCDDLDANINPDATEIPNNNVDEDCDGVALIIDDDMDGFNSDEDCDDNNAMINPDATEIVNNDIDEDCDGIAQMIDMDNDGFNSDDDCDDTNPNINPDATEIPNNGIDEDCDGVDGIIDEDNDGFSSTEDCDDTNPLINPDAVEIPNNNVDENCDGIILIIDEDNDGFNSDEDCDDTNANINPNAIEECDELDNNCDGQIDEGFNFVNYYTDLDMDGYGTDDSVVSFCVQPPGTSTIGGDCDDTNPDVNPGAIELANNGLDDDCDGNEWILSSVDNFENSLIVYPNPAQEYLKINMNGIEGYKISFSDNQGRTLFKGIETDLIDLSNYVNGIYILRIDNADNSKSIFKKILILK